jgi:hypothetical protein
MQAVLHSREGNRQHHTLKRSKDLWTRGPSRESELPYDERNHIHFKWVRTQPAAEVPYKDLPGTAIYQEVSAEEAASIRAADKKAQDDLRLTREAQRVMEAKAQIDAIVAAHKQKHGYGKDVEDKMMELGPKNKPYSYEKPEAYLDRLLMYANRELQNSKTWNNWTAQSVISDGANAAQYGYTTITTRTVQPVQPEKAKVKEVPIPEPVEPKRRWMRK